MQILLQFKMELKIYKVLTYLLIIPNLILGLFAITSLLVSLLGNPLGIFQTVLLLAGFVYAILSFIFLNKGVTQQQKLSFKFKNRLRLTSVLSILLSITTLIVFIPLITHPANLEQFLQASINNSKMTLPKEIPMSVFIKMFKFILVCFASYFALFLLHIFMTYKFSKMYAEVFEEFKFPTA